VTDSIKLAVCSVPVGDCQRHCVSAVVEAAERGADLVLLPEEPDIVAGEEAGQHILTEHPVFISYADQARIHSIGVVGSLSAKVDGGIANVGFLISREGQLIGTYRKQHPAPTEEYIVTQPDESDLCFERFPIFEFEGVTLGIGICMDIHFPEMFRIYMLKGADMVLLPTMYLDYTGDMLESVEKARAADNQLYIALSRYIEMPFLAGKNMGYAKVISPDGRIIASTAHKPGVVVADFDPAWRMPFWGEGYGDLRQVFMQTRKPETYTEILLPRDETFAGMIPVDVLRLPPAERIKTVFIRAREEMRRFGHATLAPEHLLLGMMSEDDNNAARILQRIGIDGDSLRSALHEAFTHRSREPGGRGGAVDAILDRAADEALDRNLHYIDTEHILLAITHNEASVAAQALISIGADYDTVSDWVKKESD
jgi:omega-amidase